MTAGLRERVFSAGRQLQRLILARVAADLNFHRCEEHTLQEQMMKHRKPSYRRPMLAADVVVDEIMYHAANPAAPGQAAIGEEYVEIYNKGNAAANLSGWHF